MFSTSSEQQKINSYIKDNKIVLISNTEMKLLPSFELLFKQGFVFASLDQEAALIELLQRNLEEAQKEQDIVNEKARISEVVASHGFALSFDAFEIPGYVRHEDYIVVEAIGTDPGANKFELGEISATNRLPLRTLLELSSQTVDEEKLRIETARGGSETLFISNEKDAYGSYSLFYVRVNVFLYALELKKIPREKKYFIIPNQEGYQILYSERGSFYNAFQMRSIPVNTLIEVNKDTFIIPWLFKDFPSQEIADKLESIS